MTVLITGGSGFIGSHLGEYIFENTDSSIIIFDNFSTGRESNLMHVNTDRVGVYPGDIRDEETITDAVRRADSVFHLAASVGVKRVVESPLESLQTNVLGTENVLQAAAEHQTPVFLASSSEVYGKSQAVPFSEDDDRVLGPTNISRWGYASGKATDEALALAYHEQQDLPVVVGRYFNIVGPRQAGQYGMVIPRFVEQALAGEPLTVYGDGTQTRSFTHVHDAVELTYELLSTPEAHGDVVNIGTPEPRSINDLANRVIEITGSDSSIKHIPFEEVYGPDFEEPDQREPDVSKLQELVGWVPDADLDRSLHDVIAERREAMVTMNE